MIEDNEFYTGGIIKYDGIEELQNFINQTNGNYISKEELDRIIDLLNNVQSTNVENSTLY